MQKKYDYIAEFIIKASCIQPLHIGSSDGDKGEILIDFDSNIPFINASSISGCFGDYLIKAKNGDKSSKERLFGRINDENKKAEHNKSKINFSNAVFTKNTLKIERRPRVKINGKTGTVFEENRSGQKFDIICIGAGAEFYFSIFLICFEEEKNDFISDIKEILKALSFGEIAFGGQKSNGYGKVKSTNIYFNEFNLKKESELKKWLEYDILLEYDKINPCMYSDILNEINETNSSFGSYNIIFETIADSSVIIKGISVTQMAELSPDAVSIKNANGKFIIPGSSFKGVIKNRAVSIAKYLGISELIDEIFGSQANEKYENGNPGKIVFYDTEFEDSKNKSIPRIKIDKFTSGVIENALFTEESVCGKLNFCIKITKFDLQKKAIALLLFSLRDLAVEAVSIGGNSSIGYGFLNAKKIKIEQNKTVISEIDIKSGNVTKGNGFITDCIQSLKVV